MDLAAQKTNLGSNLAMHATQLFFFPTLELPSNNSPMEISSPSPALPHTIDDRSMSLVLVLLFGICSQCVDLYG